MHLFSLLRVLCCCSLSCHCLYSLSTVREEVIRISSKQVMQNTGEFVVVDVEGKSYGLRRNLWLGNVEPPNWNHIEVESKGTYLAKIYGLRNTALGWRPNIVRMIPLHPHNDSGSSFHADILAGTLSKTKHVHF